MEDRRWDDVVYSSQMVVEHSVKAVLMGLGIHFTKQHDVSDLLLGVAGRVEVPDWFRQNIGKVSDALAKLSEQRALASYGFEEGIGVGYFEDFAPQALADAQYVYARCRDALDEILQNRSPEG